MEIINRLKKERQKQGLNQVELANKSGTNSHTISNMELGLTYPSIRLVKEIAKQLGLQLILRPTKQVTCDLQSYSNKQLINELEKRLNND